MQIVDLRPNRFYLAGGPGVTGPFNFVQTGQSTDGTPFLLPSSFAVAVDTSVHFRLRIGARQSAGSGTIGTIWHHEFTGTIKNIGGTTTISTLTEFTLAEDTLAATWAASVVANNTTDTLDVSVTGEAGKTIEWISELFYTTN